MPSKQNVYIRETLCRVFLDYMQYTYNNLSENKVCKKRLNNPC